MSVKRIVFLLITCLVAVGALGLFSSEWVEERFDGEGLSSVTTLLAASFFSCLQLLFQALRFFTLLPRRESPPFRTVAHAYFWGQALNGWVPFRGGDALKAYSLRKTGLAYVVGGLVSDRVVDVLALVLLAGLCFGTDVLIAPLRGVPGNTILLGAAALGGLALPLFVLRSRWWEKYQGLLRGLLPLRNPRTAAVALTFAALAWIAEAFALQALAKNSGTLDLGQALGSLVLLNVAIAVPVLPANVGVFEGGLALGLQKSGFTWETGLTIAAIHHALQIFTPFFLAFLWRLSKRESAPNGISLEHKGKAIRYYQNKAVLGYEMNVSRGILSYFRNRERDAVLSLAEEFSTGKTLIDVGCGGGFYTRRAKEAGLRVTAVDICPKMLKQVEGIADETRLADLDTLALSHTYDWVVCAGVLDFVSNPDSAFSRLASLVTPGGSLLILAPRIGLGGTYYRLEKWLGGGFNVNLYSRAWFERLGAKSGLELIRMETPLPTNLAIRLRKLSPILP